jgi:hypothetical protein
MADMANNTSESTSPLQIPISSIRDEPFVRPPPCCDLVVARTSLPDLLRPEYHKYKQPRRFEIAPGYQDDGRITIRHPFVDLLLARMPSISPQEGRKPPVEAWWRKGIKEKNVNEILDMGIYLNEYQSECVFALAALRVLYHPENPKHFAFWGREPAQKTAERVQKVLRESQHAFHCPSPPHACRDRVLALSDRDSDRLGRHD